MKDTSKKTIELNRRASEVHLRNAKWWQDLQTGQRISRNPGELLMLVVTEIAEACEGARKDLMDDKLPHRKMEEVEMADAYIRFLDFAGGFKIKLEWVESNSLDSLSNKAACMLLISEAVVKCFKYDCADEVSYAMALIVEYCKKFGWDLPGAIEEKLAYNANREDHKIEARLAQGGKKF